MWWFFEGSIIFFITGKFKRGEGIGEKEVSNAKAVDLTVDVVQDGGEELLDGIGDVSDGCIIVILWGRIECCNVSAELVISEMEVEELAVNVIQDGGNEGVDGIVMGRVLVQCMMWLGWNVGFGVLNLGRVGNKETMVE
jgi:hypothetical protein